MALFSNNVKVSLFPENFKEQSISRSSSVTVLEYGYAMSRSINDYREAYGSSSGGTLTVKVRVGTRDNLDIYYERLHNTFTSSFSFIFNAVFDDGGHLTDYSGAVIADGYIIDIQEDYERASDKAGGMTTANAEQISMTFRILLSKLEYIGDMNSLSLSFTR